MLYRYFCAPLVIQQTISSEMPWLSGVHMVLAEMVSVGPELQLPEVFCNQRQDEDHSAHERQITEDDL